MQFQQFF